MFIIDNISFLSHPNLHLTFDMTINLIYCVFISDAVIVPKTKFRKVERKLVPVLEKLSVEELMETNTYQRFNRSIEKIFNNTEDTDLTMENGKL